MGAVSVPGVNWLGDGVDHAPSSSPEVKERVELYLYSPSGPSWPVIGWTFLPLGVVRCILSRLTGERAAFPRYPLNRKLDGPQNRSGRFGKELPRIELRFLIPAHKVVATEISYCISEIPHFDEICFIFRLKFQGTAAHVADCDSHKERTIEEQLI